MYLDLLQCKINGTEYRHHVNNPAFKFIVAELEVTNFDIKERGMFSFGVALPELQIGGYKYKQCDTAGFPQLGLGARFPAQMKTTFQLVFQVPTVLISDGFKIRMPNGQFSPVWQFKVEGTLPTGERNEVLEQKAIAMAKDAKEGQMGAYWMTLLFPGLAMFSVGKVFQGLLCIVLQLTGLGWIPASIWASITITADANSKKQQAALLRRVANPDNLHTEVEELKPGIGWDNEWQWMIVRKYWWAIGLILLVVACIMGSLKPKDDATTAATGSYVAPAPSPTIQTVVDATSTLEVPRAQPEVRRVLPVNATPAITSSEVASETIGQPTHDGERYPQTRQRLLAIEDINGLNAAEVRYAINEIYARHGATFPNHPEIQQQFKKFDWYHPDANLSFNDIDQLMSDIERENVKTLAQYRANASQSESQAPKAELVQPEMPKPEIRKHEYVIAFTDPKYGPGALETTAPDQATALKNFRQVHPGAQVNRVILKR